MQVINSIPDYSCSSTLFTKMNKYQMNGREVLLSLYIKRETKESQKNFRWKIGNVTEDFLLECQNGFRKGRFCMDSAFCIKLLIEKRRV
jgi:hypothetical protein